MSSTKESKRPAPSASPEEQERLKRREAEEQARLSEMRKSHAKSFHADSGGAASKHGKREREASASASSSSSMSFGEGDLGLFDDELPADSGPPHVTLRGVGDKKKSVLGGGSAKKAATATSALRGSSDGGHRAGNGGRGSDDGGGEDEGWPDQSGAEDDDIFARVDKRSSAISRSASSHSKKKPVVVRELTFDELMVQEGLLFGVVSGKKAPQIPLCTRAATDPSEILEASGLSTEDFFTSLKKRAWDYRLPLVQHHLVVMGELFNMRSVSVFYEMASHLCVAEADGGMVSNELFMGGGGGGMAQKRRAIINGMYNCLVRSPLPAFGEIRCCIET